MSDQSQSSNSWPEGMCKPHYGKKVFSQSTNGVYFIVIIKKSQLRNGGVPITDPITEMGVAHAFQLGLAAKLLTLLSWEQENILLELRSTFSFKFSVFS